MMKHLNEIKRIKELMSLISEGEGLKYLERLLKKGSTQTIQKAELAIDDVIKILDDETVQKLQTLGIRDSTDLSSKLSLLDEELASNIAKALMRNSSEYSKMFFNLLKNNETYLIGIEGLEKIIQTNPKIKTIEDVNKIIDVVAEKSGWDPVVTFNLKQNLKPKINFENLVGGDATNYSGIVSKIGAGLFEVSKKGLTIVATVLLVAVSVPWILKYLIREGIQGFNELQTQNNDPNFQDDKLIERIITGNMNSDFTSNYPDYAEALPTSYKNTIVKVIDAAKTPPTNGSTEAVLQTQLYENTNLLRTIADGFHLKYVMDVAMLKGVKINTDEFISQMKDRAIKPFILYKELAEVNVESTFKSLELQREQLVKKYTTILKKCEGESGYLPFDLGNNKDRFYGMVNNLVIGFITKRKVGALGTMAEKAGQVIKTQAGIDISSAASNEDELKTQIESQMINSGFFPNLQQCKYNFQFELNESITIKNKGLVELLKKKDLLLIDEGIGGGGGGTSKSGNTSKKITPSYDTVNCPPKDKLVDFQRWLDNSEKPWYKNGQLKGSGPYGTCGQYTKEAWKTYKTEYEQSKSSGGQQVKPTITIQSINPEIANVSKNVWFYNESGIIPKFYSSSPQYNTENPFDSSVDIIKVVEQAKKLKDNNAFKPVIAYINAVIQMYGYLKITSFSVLPEYKDDIDEYIKTSGGQLLESTIKPLIGLSKLLFEQTTGRVTYRIETKPGQGKFISTKKTNYYPNLTMRAIQSIKQISPTLKLSGKDGLPDEAPIISFVKAKLNVNENPVTNIFTPELQNKIIEYRRRQQLGNADGEGNLDIDIFNSLFPPQNPQ